jgi:hypothetical protein
VERIDVVVGLRSAAAIAVAPVRVRAVEAATAAPAAMATKQIQATKPSAHGPAQVCGGFGYRNDDLGLGHLVWDRRPLDAIGASPG